MKLTILGSGTSFGVPQLGCRCAVCTSEDPRDKRTRVSAVIEEKGVRVLIDTAPELRLQLLNAGIASVDAVLYTHDHADHTHGIDDLRAMSVRHGRLPVYGPSEMLERLVQRFPYIFDDAMVLAPDTSKPDLTPVPLEAGHPVTIAGIEVLPLEFRHGTIRVFGYRAGPIAYVTDVKKVEPAAIAALKGVKLLVLSALFEYPHTTHQSIPEAIEVARAIGAERTLLTHLPHNASHASLLARLPAGVEPAYDGLAISF